MEGVKYEALSERDMIGKRPGMPETVLEVLGIEEKNVMTSKRATSRRRCLSRFGNSIRRFHD